MEFIRTHKTEIIVGIGILALYLITRLLNIMHLPLFTDEAIYVRWSQIANQDASWRFISLTDGKQPMYVWITMSIMRLIHDPLLAGRLTAVGAGFLGTIGMFVLSRELFKNKWIGLLAAGLYVVFPFALVYDRMAMYDNMVAMFLIWGMYVEVLLARRVKAYLAFVAGLVIGGGMLTKTNAFFSWYFLPLGILLVNWSKKQRWNRILSWAAFAIIAGALAYVYYNILRLSPYFGIISEKNYTFIYSPREFLQHPFLNIVGNFHGLFGWFIDYANWLGFALSVASLFVLRKFWREKVFLLIWCWLPFLALAFDGKVLYPRYIFPMVIFLLPLIAVALYESFRLFKTKFIGIAFIILLFGMYLYVDRFIIFDFPHAPIAGPDLQQYSNSWPAGGGVNTMIAYLSNKAKTQKIFVASEGTFGSVPTLAVQIYLDKNTNVEKEGLWPVPPTIPQDLLKKAKTMPVYMVFEQTQTPPPGWPLKLIAKYRKGASNWYMSLYQVTVK